MSHTTESYHRIESFCCTETQFRRCVKIGSVSKCIRSVSESKERCNLLLMAKSSHQEIYTPIQTSAIIYQSLQIIAMLVTHSPMYLSEWIEWKVVCSMSVTYCNTKHTEVFAVEKKKSPSSLKSPIAIPCLTPLSKCFPGFTLTKQPQTLVVREHCVGQQSIAWQNSAWISVGQWLLREQWPSWWHYRRAV